MAFVFVFNLEVKLSLIINYMANIFGGTFQIVF